MCCHRLFIYTTCGHSTFAPEPLVLCRHAAIPPDSDHSTMCKIIAHPYKSLRLEQLCPPCQRRRDSMLGRIEQCQHVEFDEYKWKVSYAMPMHGKDYWTKKMEDRLAAEEAEGKELARKKRRRLSWKRRSGRSKGG
ncbi:hypothetical protein LTR91_022775 [Friedmanniomyces endolithicus]|uniref:Uncharacterized protein n=1 Tax=Friedmanniomyces endolithicus TaxID=329885 RepID=A0A4U0V7G4_9PEZI|nr:hypothetical protein LTS09_008562 [Friedmanniomyces endolithicus]KAK0354075.1 hypothetical protein LTR94_014027 [Friedmanniomyces endolithicus]KAK0774676.1 hypothetical protein LTR59_014795 [Friedmanniomyces endolithicus]KAK0804674.1 hypothetical protein LTR38_005779 [Friedmanniomyces endolithicus]KAK0808138.1 hypothetical protein LTR75_006415 [Friedmanniomyces endolithicus]